MFTNSGVPFTSIESVGEFRLIELITRDFKSFSPHLVQGIGDDAAVIAQPDGSLLLISTDAMVEGIHFDCSYTPLKHLGYKAAITNFSDIFAMNGKPFAITVSISVSNQFSVEALQELYSGIQIACKEHEVDLIGGNTTAIKSGLHIGITVLGKVAADRISYRKGAKPYEILCVTGDLGAAYAGLQILEREKAVYLTNPSIQPDLSEFAYVVERQLRPPSRKEVINFFEKANIVPTAMIDISDGLVSEIYHICKASNVGATFYQNKLPIDYQTIKVAELFELPVTTYALYGGEDYELLFSIKQTDYEKVSAFRGITPIGYIEETPLLVRMVQADNSVVDIKPMGYEHFRSN
ncbi:MAG: thiamine-phosphate kinase [Bacteroidia bacterium]|nr:thiamine-phosphate kinase [Bacteroidia bacterium]MDW8157797.1 thiamine-phosphate kinase [Bacteroidia bacterium]